MDRFKSLSPKKRTMSRLWPYLRKSRHLLLAGILLAIVLNVAELLRPYILMIVIDEFLIPGRADEGIYSIFSLGILFLLCIVTGATMTVVQAIVVNRMGQESLMRIRRDVFSHIQRLPMKTLDRFSAGRLITRTTNDVEALNELFVDVLVNIIQDGLMLIGITGMMFFINWRLALIAFITIPFILLVTLIIRYKLRKNFIRVKSLISRINGFFAENISGMRLVQIFCREKEKQDEFFELNDDYKKAVKTQVRLNSFMMPMVDIISTFGVALLVFYGIRGITGNVLEVGMLYAFVNYIRQFFTPINDLAERYGTIQSAAISCDRIFELLDDEDGVEDLETGDPVVTFNGQIEFRNVWFAYRENEWVLKDVSFTIKPGESVAFVGSTGSGKTTIINLIARFYEIQRGSILIDGKDIRQFNLGQLRRQFAVVLQDVFLFSGSIADNIRLDDNEIDDDLIHQSLSLAGADGFITNLSKGMDEPVSERGSNFSLGQRQLLSFARAIAHDPTVFVLDEATANIDTETERQLQNSLASASQNRTSIIIAHRLSTIRDCDIIFVMSHGKIAEQGNHAQLLGKNGIYAKLYNQQ